MVRVGPPGILLADLPFRYEAFAKQELDYVALGFKTLWQLLEYWKDFVKLTKEVNVKYVLRYSVRLRQACFLYTFEKTQGQNNSMFWPLAKNSRILSQNTQSYEAQSKTSWYRILALKL